MGKKRNERGQSLVEAAVCLPLLLVLFVGIFEFGRVLMIQQTITNAAREGARMGALYMNDDEALDTASNVATDYLVRSGVDTAVANVNSEFTMINGSDAVQVTIQYDYSSVLTVWVPGISDPFALNSNVVMRREA